MRGSDFSVKVVRHRVGCGNRLGVFWRATGKSRFLTGLSSRFGMTRFFGEEPAWPEMTRIWVVSCFAQAEL
jgi:hypothetical protein